MFTIELIDKFYPSAYRELQAKIADQGLEIVSLSELADVDWEKATPITLKRVRQ